MTSKTVSQSTLSSDVKKISDLLAMEEYLDIDLPVPTFIDAARPIQELIAPTEI
jgi:hypothetical protein